MEAALYMADPAYADPTGEERAAKEQVSAVVRDPEGRAPTLELLFREHFKDVYRLVARLLGPAAERADIEDLTQQVFLNAHRALPRYRGEAKASTWICGVAARTVMTQIRGWRRRRRMLEALEREPIVKKHSSEADELVARRQELCRVWACLSRMSSKKRVVYLLHEIEGMSGADVARALEIPVATVWTRLHHARRELLRELSREESR